MANGFFYFYGIQRCLSFMIVFVTGLFCFYPAFYIGLPKAPTAANFETWQLTFGSQFVGCLFRQF
jgi:hypothetical protein